MAILILQEQGKLDVRESICRYIAGCPREWEGITLHHLLTHTSGIPDYTGFRDFPSLIGVPATEQELITRFKALPLEFPPGAMWKYSNSGYILLGDIITRVSLESYSDFLQQNIFTPLQMSSTGYDSNHPSLPEHATGYLSLEVKPVFLDMSEFDAAGALYSTVGDLFVWDEALAMDRLVPQQTLDAMVAPQVSCPAGGCALPSDVGYGYGWFIANQAGKRYIYHWGRIDGFRSSNGFYPEERVDVVVLNNLETTDVFAVSTELGTRALALP
jgi:CubicO group peptidase (beta-lactamase class C family)